MIFSVSLVRNHLLESELLLNEQKIINREESQWSLVIRTAIIQGVPKFTVQDLPMHSTGENKTSPSRSEEAVNASLKSYYKNTKRKAVYARTYVLFHHCKVSQYYRV